MRLSLKLTLALTGAILVVVGANSIIRVRREINLFEQDMRDDSRLMGRAVAGAAQRIWHRVGEAEARDVVVDANEREGHMHIGWVTLDSHPGPAPANPKILELSIGAEPVSLVGVDPETGEDTLFTYTLVAGPDGQRAGVELRESLAAEHQYVRTSILQATLGTLALVTAVSLITLWLGVVLVGRPVRELVAQARRIGKGELGARLALRTHDEMGELATEMNAMSERLESSRDQLRHADRLATVGKLSAGIAHEVGTPLNVITGYAQLIEDECPAPHPANEGAATIRMQALRVAAIIRQLLDFARPRPLVKQSTSLQGLVEQAAHLLETLTRKRGVEVQVGEDRGVTANVDPAQLQQVVTNLVVNAMHASKPGSVVNLVVEQRRATGPMDDVGEREYACIEIRDHGSGMPPEVVERIFEPFFTTKDVGEGTGLGLSVAYGIIREHGGWIAVDSTVGEGSCFTVYVPVEAPR